MTVSRSWGLASLMRCAERAVYKTKGYKTKTSEHERPLVNMGEASTGPSGLSNSRAEDLGSSALSQGPPVCLESIQLRGNRPINRGNSRLRDDHEAGPRQTIPGEIAPRRGAARHVPWPGSGRFRSPQSGGIRAAIP